MICFNSNPIEAKIGRYENKFGSLYMVQKEKDPDPGETGSDP